LTTRARSPGAVRLATAMSMAAVPPPARTKGWLSGPACQTWRIRSRAVPNDAMSGAAVWPGGGALKARRTAGETSIGPGIMSRGAVMRISGPPPGGGDRTPPAGVLHGGGYRALGSPVLDCHGRAVARGLRQRGRLTFRYGFISLRSPQKIHSLI